MDDYNNDNFYKEEYDSADYETTDYSMNKCDCRTDSPLCRKCVCQYNRLEEARFWSRIMQEHALFIKLGLPADQPMLREEAQNFIDLFENLRRRLDKVNRLEGDLLEDLIKAVKLIIEFKAKLLRLLIQCKEAPGSNYPLLLDHTRREAKRFLGLLLKPEPEDSLDLLLEQEEFWLRKEHIEFVIHLLDPSERELLEQAEGFRKIFSRLLETGRDLESMNGVRPKNFNTVIRFTQDVIKNTMLLRDFKAAAFELAKLCEVLSIISTPLLLDHIRREADKFLSELNMLLPEVTKCQSTLKQDK